MVPFRTAGSLSLPVTAAGLARTATLGVRPEHVRLTDAADGWAATVTLIEPLGDETLVFLDCGGQGALVAKMDAEEAIAPGDRRRVTFRRDRLLFFDGTGERI